MVSVSVRLRWCRLQEYYNDGWHGTWAQDGGVTNQQAIHHVDALTWICGNAKAVSAKSHEFDPDGNEVRTDYYKMMNIVLNHGYTGYVGIEYEGNNHSEYDGIHLTSKLLRKIQEQNS